MLKIKRLSRILALTPALSMVLLMTGPVLGQQTFIPPDPEKNTIDKACLGPALIGNEEQLRYESFMTSAVQLSPVARTATLPMFKGYDASSNPVYYIVTESSDCGDAMRRGVNYSPKLAFLLDSSGNPVNASVQKVTVDGGGAVHFPASGGVDFSPVRILTPSTAASAFPQTVPGLPEGFPPTASIPGSVGQANYSPLITIAGSHIVLNATQVANSTGIKDFMPQIDFVKMTATFNLVLGIYDFRFVMYLRMDASDPGISGFEGGIYAPNLELAPTGGDRFFAHLSARQTILPILNGIRGVDRISQRQGVQSSALGEGDPFNVMGSKPGDDEYSPLWDLTPVVWTQPAIDSGQRRRLRQDDEVKNFLNAGLLTGLGAGAINADFGIHSLGVVSNCPIMLRVLDGLIPYDPANPNPDPVPQ